jgi:hypothetical protein
MSKEKKTSKKSAALREDDSGDDAASDDSARLPRSEGESLSVLQATASVGLPKCREYDASPAIGTVYEIQPTDADTVLPLSDFYIVVDRVAFRADDQGRIGDSISQAYQATMKFNVGLEAGRVTVMTTEGKRLSLALIARAHSVDLHSPLHPRLSFLLILLSGPAPPAMALEIHFPSMRRRLFPNPCAQPQRRRSSSVLDAFGGL